MRARRWRVLVLVAGLHGVAAGEPGRHASLTGELDCSACHTADGWAMAAAGGRGFDHARTGFPLRGAHAATACVACHDGRRQISVECASCHADPHAGQLAGECASCHSAVAWQETRARERHQLTLLPLTGRHALLDCTACHVTTARTYTAVPADCFACHQKDYLRTDVHPIHAGTATAAPLPRTCGECHRPSGWTPAVISPSAVLQAARARPPASHDALFPVSSGKHRGAPCASCHLAESSPRRVSCTGCHAHDQAALPRLHRGRAAAGLGAGCLRCHPGGSAR